MEPLVGDSFVAELNEERALAFDQRGDGEGSGGAAARRPAAKRPRNVEKPITTPFGCQCHNNAIVNLKNPNLKDCFECFRRGKVVLVEDPNAPVRSGCGFGPPDTSLPPHPVPLVHLTIPSPPTLPSHRSALASASRAAWCAFAPARSKCTSPTCTKSSSPAG